jgi:hypothetical protein
MKPLFAMLAALTLFGAGCFSSQPAVNATPPVPAVETPTPTPVVIATSTPSDTATTTTATATTTVQTGPNWKMITDATQGIEYQYPEKLSTEYIGTNEWPPTVTVSSVVPPCVATSTTEGAPSQASQRAIGDRAYCVVSGSGAAAGSTYTEYAYTTPWQYGSVTIRFTLQYPQCMNYDDPKQSACKQEQASFDLDGMVDRIVTSIQQTTQGS